ncbi:hypothetical protein R69619_00407 [Paraburkholderia nemoris]|nr:hypothetical protein R69619_00407 [Paraburkholderia nemoris]
MATMAEANVVALTAALAEKNARVETARSAGRDTSGLKRQVAQIESELATAKRRASEELHALPGVSALALRVEHLESDLAAAQSAIELLQAAPAT